MNQNMQNQDQQGFAAISKIRKYMCMNNMAQKILASSKKHLRAKLSYHNVTFNQWHILRLLYTNEAATPSKMAAHMGCDGGAITRQLDVLETRGIIYRVRKKQDRRVIEIALTEKGKSMTKNIIESFEQYSECLTASLSEKERTILSYVNTCLVEIETAYEKKI